MFSTVPSVLALCSVTLQLLSSRGRFYFPIPWIWAELVTCFGQYNTENLIMCEFWDWILWTSVFFQNPHSVNRSLLEDERPLGASRVLLLTDILDLPTCHLSTEAWASSLESRRTWSTSPEPSNQPIDWWAISMFIHICYWGLVVAQCLFIYATNIWWLHSVIVAIGD